MPNLASEIIRPETSGKVFEISRCYDVFLLFGWDQILSFGWEIPNIVSWLPSFGHLKISEDPYTPLPINRSRTSGSPNSILSGAGGDPEGPGLGQKDGFLCVKHVSVWCGIIWKTYWKMMGQQNHIKTDNMDRHIVDVQLSHAIMPWESKDTGYIKPYKCY